MSKNEWKDTCDECKECGSAMFARIFYRKINGVWKYLCTSCWNKYDNKLNPTGEGQPDK